MVDQDGVAVAGGQAGGDDDARAGGPDRGAVGADRSRPACRRPQRSPKHEVTAASGSGFTHVAVRTGTGTGTGAGLVLRCTFVNDSFGLASGGGSMDAMDATPARPEAIVGVRLAVWIGWSGWAGWRRSGPDFVGGDAGDAEAGHQGGHHGVAAAPSAQDGSDRDGGDDTPT